MSHTLTWWETGSVTYSVSALYVKQYASWSFQLWHQGDTVYSVNVPSLTWATLSLTRLWRSWCSMRHLLSLFIFQYGYICAPSLDSQWLNHRIVCATVHFVPSSKALELWKSHPKSYAFRFACKTTLFIAPTQSTQPSLIQCHWHVLGGLMLMYNPECFLGKIALETEI